MASAARRRSLNSRRLCRRRWCRSRGTWGKRSNSEMPYAKIEQVCPYWRPSEHGSRPQSLEDVRRCRRPHFATPKRHRPMLESPTSRKAAKAVRPVGCVEARTCGPSSGVRRRTSMSIFSLADFFGTLDEERAGSAIRKPPERGGRIQFLAAANSSPWRAALHDA